MDSDTLTGMETKRASIFVVVAMILLVAAVALSVGISSHGTSIPSLMIRFDRYGTAVVDTNQSCAFLTVSNSGSCSVYLPYVPDVADSPSRQTADVKTADGWAADAWNSNPPHFVLRPGKVQQLTFSSEASANGRIALSARGLGFADRCPRCFWRVLPERMRRLPRYSVFWSDLIPTSPNEEDKQAARH